MPTVFQPHRTIYVRASKPHPDRTQYRVAFGYEDWGTQVPITKVQMVYNEKVAGRISPSFPHGSDDEDNVIEALKLLRQGEGATSKNERIVLCSVKINEVGASLDDVIAEIGDEINDELSDTFPHRAFSTDFVKKIGKDDRIILIYRVFST